MNPILLHPTDVLFFRDGRPMSGSLSGQGAAWPLPNVISHAFHAALHRADLGEVHAHRSGKSGEYTDQRDRKFGSLKTVGPFPVCTNGEANTWFFPRPLDTTVSDEKFIVSLRPVKSSGASNLPVPLKYTVGNQKPPTKDLQPAWCSEGALATYLGTEARDSLAARQIFKQDRDFSDAESTIGIGINSETGTAEDQKIYSANYLRLRDGWRLGTFASAPDKDFRHSNGSNDLVGALLNADQGSILVGGQQRVCTASRDASIVDRLPLPLGKTSGFSTLDGKVLVKWTLLTPAIFPEIDSHTGGWLPSWIEQKTGQVMLLDGPGKNAAKRKRVREGQPIKANLVAAMTGKPLVVTGWALPNSTDRPEDGAKSTHLAVPAGSVYYFECDDESSARQLAAALNWHGVTASVPLAGSVAAPVSVAGSQVRGSANSPQAGGSGNNIENRRSTLMGEKGFGLGVCSSWNF